MDWDWNWDCGLVLRIGNQDIRDLDRKLGIGIGDRGFRFGIGIG